MNNPISTIETEVRKNLQKSSLLFLRKITPGCLISALIALSAIWCSNLLWFKDHGLSALTVAILIGIGLGNTLYKHFEYSTHLGVEFAKKYLLRLGIVLYGLRLTTQEIAQVGMSGIVTDVLIVCSTFTLAYLLGTRWLGLDRQTTILIGAGSSICGAAAVLATEPVIQGRSAQVAVAISTVVVFGTLSMFLYPLLFVWNQEWIFLPGGTNQFGIYVGSTIHEVAQVVVAARTVDGSVTDTAVITKMIRVMMLAPFLVALSVAIHLESNQQTTKNPITSKVIIPWFALAFIGVTLFNSMDYLPHQVKPIMIALDNYLLAMSMAALGLTTQFSAIKKAGIKPLFLAFLLFVWLVIGGAIINRWIFYVL